MQLFSWILGYTFAADLCGRGLHVQQKRSTLYSMCKFVISWEVWGTFQYPQAPAARTPQNVAGEFGAEPPTIWPLPTA